MTTFHHSIGTTPVQDTIISHVDYYNSLLIAHTTSHPPPFLTVHHNTRMKSNLLEHKVDLRTPLIQLSNRSLLYVKCKVFKAYIWSLLPSCPRFLLFSPFFTFSIQTGLLIAPQALQAYFHMAILQWPLKTILPA